MRCGDLLGERHEDLPIATRHIPQCECACAVRASEEDGVPQIHRAHLTVIRVCLRSSRYAAMMGAGARRRLPWLPMRGDVAQGAETMSGAACAIVR